MFNIGDDFNVFDEWGNFVGTFTPAGSGGWEGILIALFLLAAVGVFFAAYSLIRITLVGIVAIFRGEWWRAFKYLLLPGVLFALIVYSQIATANAEAHQRSIGLSIIQTAKENPDLVIKVHLIGPMPGNRFGVFFTTYEVTNLTEATFDGKDWQNGNCGILNKEGWQYIAQFGVFPPGTTMTIACPNDTKILYLYMHDPGMQIPVHLK